MHRCAGGVTEGGQTGDGVRKGIDRTAIKGWGERVVKKILVVIVV
jgi:hypothetical protein